ncbi:MAG: hypothetical protein AAGI38_12575, partial [Bacteroidota bacterium]
GSPDKVEIYRSVNNNLQLKTSAPIDITADEWYDCKVRYEPLTGRIDVYLDNELVLTWVDPAQPLKNGLFVSLRTGSSQVLFDDFRVYREFSPRYPIGVGRKPSDLLRYNSPSASKPAARVITLEKSRDGQWYLPHQTETVIKGMKK